MRHAVLTQRTPQPHIIQGVPEKNHTKFAAGLFLQPQITQSSGFQKKTCLHDKGQRLNASV